MSTGAQHGGGVGSRGTIRQGKATKPLHLPALMPPCFRSQEQWDDYKQVAIASAGDGFTYCSDCTPERQADMIAQGRCVFPGTTFRRLSRGNTVGRRLH